MGVAEQGLLSCNSCHGEWLQYPLFFVYMCFQRPECFNKKYTLFFLKKKTVNLLLCDFLVKIMNARLF